MLVEVDAPLEIEENGTRRALTQDDIRGPAGADGQDGAPGANGTNGTNGVNGADGSDGADGASAYEIAVANGFAGSEAAWLASLEGPPGADGADGTDADATAAIAAHSADTTAVHGIADTSVLATATDIAGRQPLDSDLTAIAALSTTSFGRALLELANAAAGRAALGLGSAAVAATGDFDASGAAASAQAASQPLDSDLTAIAALTTTSYGRAFLALADAAAGRTALGLGTAATSASSAFDASGAAAAAQAASQPLDSDLTAIAALTTTSYGRAFLALADAAAARTATGAEASANKDTDGTLAANSDTKYPSQKAVKTYVDRASAYDRLWTPGGLGETIRRPFTATNSAVLVGGRLSLAGGIVLPAGATVTNLSVMSGSTALSAGTHQWFCLVDLAGNVLRKTVNDTSTAWGAATVKTLALSSTYTPSAEIAVYIGVVVVATTVPTLTGVANTGAGVGVAPFPARRADTGKSDPASLGSTVTFGVNDLAFYAYPS